MLVEQVALGPRVGGEGAEEGAHARAAVGLLDEGEQEGATGDLVDGFGEAVEVGGGGFDDLLDAVDFAAFEDGGEEGAGARAGAVVEGLDDAGEEPVGQEQGAGGGDLFPAAQDALGEHGADEFAADVGLAEVGTQVDADLDVEAAVGELGDLGGDGLAGLGGGVAGAEQDDDGDGPGLLVAQELAQLFGDVLAFAGKGAAQGQGLAMDDELTGRAGGTGVPDPGQRDRGDGGFCLRHGGCRRWRRSRHGHGRQGRERRGCGGGPGLQLTRQRRRHRRGGRGLGGGECGRLNGGGLAALRR